MNSVDTLTQYAVQYGLQAAVAHYAAVQCDLNKVILERLRDAQIECPPSFLSAAR